MTDSPQWSYINIIKYKTSICLWHQYTVAAILILLHKIFALLYTPSSYYAEHSLHKFLLILFLMILHNKYHQTFKTFYDSDMCAERENTQIRQNK